MRPHKTVKRDCYFCREGARDVDYKNVVVLRRFLSKRGTITTRESRWVRKKIWDKEREEWVYHPDPNVGKWTGGNGLCRVHQRQLRKAIMRAREMALIPYVVPQTHHRKREMKHLTTT